MSVEYLAQPNRKTANCRDCGVLLDVGEGLLVAISYYDWDNPDSDVAGSFLNTDYEVRCGNTIEHNATACAERVVAQGTNMRALKAIARDYENLGHTATDAKRILAEYTELAHQQAHAADLAAREDGWGVIGGPAHRQV